MPAPRCTSTSWPRSASSRTPAGVVDTRYSSALISAGTPTFTIPPCVGAVRAASRVSSCRRHRTAEQLTAAQREPELDPVLDAVEAPARQLLDARHPVAQRVPVAEQRTRGGLPVSVVLEERL